MREKKKRSLKKYNRMTNYKRQSPSALRTKKLFVAGGSPTTPSLRPTKWSLAGAHANALGSDTDLTPGACVYHPSAVVPSPLSIPSALHRNIPLSDTSPDFL